LLPANVQAPGATWRVALPSLPTALYRLHDAGAIRDDHALYGEFVLAVAVLFRADEPTAVLTAQCRCPFHSRLFVPSESDHWRLHWPTEFLPFQPHARAIPRFVLPDRAPFLPVAGEYL